MAERTLFEEILVQGTAEFMDLKWMTWVTRQVAEPSESEVMTLTTEAIRRLLLQDLAYVGDAVTAAGKTRIVAWQLSADEAVKKIEQEWRELDSEFVDSGEIVWLELTPKAMREGSN